MLSTVNRINNLGGQLRRKARFVPWALLKMG
jgi:hypothetical protein